MTTGLVEGDVLALNQALRMVGVTGFDPATSSSRTKRATKLRRTPVLHLPWSVDRRQQAEMLAQPPVHLRIGPPRAPRPESRAARFVRRVSLASGGQASGAWPRDGRRGVRERWAPCRAARTPRATRHPPGRVTRASRLRPATSVTGP